MATMHTFSDWTDLLAGAGARACSHCGKTASIPASLPPEQAGDRPDGAAPITDGNTSIWVCFECGHEERAVAS